MDEFPLAHSIQQWMETAPQGYLADTEFGHEPGEREPDAILGDDRLREHAIRTTVQLVVGERCALAASSGLINATPDEASKRFLATQTLDEARHVEIFTRRLVDLGVEPSQLNATVQHLASPHLVSFAGVLLDKVHKGDFVAGIVGQNIVLEGVAFTVFEMMLAMSGELNPKLAHMLVGTLADERRHVGFGEQTIGALIERHPEKKPEIERMQRDMSHFMLSAFHEQIGEAPAMADALRAAHPAGAGVEPVEWHGTNLSALGPREIEAVMGRSILSEFKTRLERIGLEYKEPPKP